MIRQAWNDILKAAMTTKGGFREVPHTADWELQVWAPNLPALLEQAAHGMRALMGVRLIPSSRQQHQFEIDFEDPESLLVAFLDELLYQLEVKQLAFEIFELRLEGSRLHGNLWGAPVESIAKEIKAVTYHNLAIRPTERGLEANIVFDV